VEHFAQNLNLKTKVLWHSCEAASTRAVVTSALRVQYKAWQQPHATATRICVTEEDLVTALCRTARCCWWCSSPINLSSTTRSGQLIKYWLGLVRSSVNASNWPAVTAINRHIMVMNSMQKGSMLFLIACSAILDKHAACYTCSIRMILRMRKTWICV